MEFTRSIRATFNIGEIVRGLKKLYPDDPLVQAMPHGDRPNSMDTIGFSGHPKGIAVFWDLPEEPKPVETPPKAPHAFPPIP